MNEWDLEILYKAQTAVVDSKGRLFVCLTGKERSGIIQRAAGNRLVLVPSSFLLNVETQFVAAISTGTPFSLNATRATTPLQMCARAILVRIG